MRNHSRNPPEDGGVISASKSSNSSTIHRKKTSNHNGTFSVNGNQAGPPGGVTTDKTNLSSHPSSNLFSPSAASKTNGTNISHKQRSSSIFSSLGRTKSKIQQQANKTSSSVSRFRLSTFHIIMVITLLMFAVIYVNVYIQIYGTTASLEVKLSTTTSSWLESLSLEWPHEPQPPQQHSPPQVSVEGTSSASTVAATAQALLSHSLLKTAGNATLTQQVTWSRVDFTKPPHVPPGQNYSCQWTVFQPSMVMMTSAWSSPDEQPLKEISMCIHPFDDAISNSIRRNYRWDDCNILPQLWYQHYDGHATNGSPTTFSKRRRTTYPSSSLYLEVGANIGPCVMEMLLSTNATIVAAEPHPRNLFALHSTMAKLPAQYQARVALFPIALGHERGISKIYAAQGNMGNAVVGKIIRDNDQQVFAKEEQHDIAIERLDTILSAPPGPTKNNVLTTSPFRRQGRHNVPADYTIPVMKMDAQGFECNILDGMGPELASKIHYLRFEWGAAWMTGHNCTTLLPRLRQWGFEITMTKDTAGGGGDDFMGNDDPTHSNNNNNVEDPLVVVVTQDWIRDPWDTKCFDMTATNLQFGPTTPRLSS